VKIKIQADAERIKNEYKQKKTYKNQ